MSAINGLGSTAADIGTNYLQLLITQLQNQNPLEPMKTQEMTSQLAQIAQVEKLESLESTFQETLLATQVQQATGMIGSEVEFIPPQGTMATFGRVDGVIVDHGDVLLRVGGERIALDEVLSIYQ